MCNILGKAQFCISRMARGNLFVSCFESTILVLDHYIWKRLFFRATLYCEFDIFV